jgi:hypothetical protein
VGSLVDLFVSQDVLPGIVMCLEVSGSARSGGAVDEVRGADAGAVLCLLHRACCVVHRCSLLLFAIFLVLTAHFRWRLLAVLLCLSLFRCFTLPLLHSSAVWLFRCFTLPLLHSSAVWLFRCFTLPLHGFFGARLLTLKRLVAAI